MSEQEPNDTSKLIEDSVKAEVMAKNGNYHRNEAAVARMAGKKVVEEFVKHPGKIEANDNIVAEYRETQKRVEENPNDQVAVRELNSLRWAGSAVSDEEDLSTAVNRLVHTVGTAEKSADFNEEAAGERYEDGQTILSLLESEKYSLPEDGSAEVVEVGEKQEAAKILIDAYIEKPGFNDVNDIVAKEYHKTKEIVEKNPDNKQAAKRLNVLTYALQALHDESEPRDAVVYMMSQIQNTVAAKRAREKAAKDRLSESEDMLDRLGVKQ
jgi:hypothetical protein